MGRTSKSRRRANRPQPRRTAWWPWFPRGAPALAVYNGRAEGTFPDGDVPAMPLRNRTAPLSLRLIGLTIPLLASSLAGCSPAPAGPDEPPPRQVRRELARLLEDTEHLRLTDFRQEGAGRYAAEAKGPGG